MQSRPLTASYYYDEIEKTVAKHLGPIKRRSIRSLIKKARKSEGDTSALTDLISAIIDNNSINTQNKSNVILDICNIPKDASLTIAISKLLEEKKLDNESFRNQFRALAGAVEGSPEEIAQALKDLFRRNPNDKKFGNIAIKHILSNIDSVSLQGIGLLKNSDTLTPKNIFQIAAQLRRAKRTDEAYYIVEIAQIKFPKNIQILNLKIFLSVWAERANDIDISVKQLVRLSTFENNLYDVYGDLSIFMPSVTRDIHDSLFPVPDADAKTEQARVYAAMAGLVVSQLRRLRVLRFGEERETTSLADWGVSVFRDAETRSLFAGNTALLLLKAALECDESSAIALRQLAELHSVYGDHEAEVAVYETLLSYEPGDKDILARYMKALCQIGRQDDAASLAREFAHGEYEVRAAPFVQIEDFSGRQDTTSVFEAASGNVDFTAYRKDDRRSVSQPVTYAELDAFQLRDVTVLEHIRLLGPQGDSLFFDPRIDMLPPTSGLIAAGDAGMVYRAPATVERISEKSIYLMGQPMQFFNYYHALIQNYSKVPYLLEKGYFDDRVFVLPDNVPVWVDVLLEFLGIAKDRTLRLDPDIAYVFDDLLLPTPARMLSLPDPVLLDALRRRLGIGEAVPKGQGKRIFWSREFSDTHRRPLINEDELRDFAVARGFEVVDPAKLTPQQQVELLSQTSIVAGPTGAAFANLIFAPRGMAAMCFAPRQSAKNYYPALGHATGSRFEWMLGEFHHEGFHGAGFPQLPYFVDIEVFSAALDDVEK